MPKSLSTISFGKLLSQRKRFIASVYSILAIQLAITFVVATYLRDNPSVYKFSMKFFIPLLIIPFTIIFAFPFCPPALKFGLFCVFSFIFGILSLGASRYVSSEVIEFALLSTLGIFIGMTIFGVILASVGIDLSFMFFMLFCALLGLLVVRIVLLFTPASNYVNKYVATFSVILFSIFIGYDTNRMLQKNYSIDVIDTAMGFYLDIENLFSNFIEIGMNNN